ncbi:MAG: cytidine deaminase [Muribaculaceae bacterium]|nr:cytidine deaminase [Muribaculaceae bacterium]
MKQIEIKTLIRECSFEELNDDDKILVSKAKEATRGAYAPYSHYQVGAALLLHNGEIVTGSNQENAAYPSGTCAERTAVFYASASNPGIPVKKLAVAAWTPPEEGKSWEDGFQADPVSPCGGCRQALMEYEHLYGPIEVFLYGRKRIYILPSVSTLLPFSFTEF